MRGVMRKDNTPCRPDASRRLGARLGAALAAALVCCLLGGAASADTGAPSPGEAQRVHAQIRAAVEAWDPSIAEEVDLPGPISITLRLEGRVLSRTVVAEGGPEAVREALSVLMDRAESRLPFQKDATWPEPVRRITGLMQIGVELGGPLVPLSLDQLADATLEISPGIEGVAVRIGERVGAGMPSRMLEDGVEPALVLRSLVSELSGDPALGVVSPDDLRREHGVRFYRFGVTHIAETEPGSSPVFLFRGGEVVRSSELRGRDLVVFAEDLALHLMMRKPREDGVADPLGGTLRPIQGVFESERATPLQLALAALALERLATGERYDAAVRAGARDFVRRLAVAGAAIGEEQTEETAAAVWSGLRASSAMFDAMVADDEGLEAFLRACDRVCDGALRRAEALGAMVRPVTLWALAERARGDESLRPRVRRMLARAWSETGPERSVSLLPWAGWAELALAEGRGEVEGEEALRRSRMMVWIHQLDAADTGLEAPDLGGGVVFTAGENPLPTWHTVRPVVFFASMLGDPRLTGREEASREASRVLASVRFLRQLSVREAEAYSHRYRHRSIGGVRAALWDQRLHPEATAMTLIAVCDTLDSLSKLAAAGDDEGG
ncbi:MAG: hypothetical protein EA423_10430 [Phycisphaerales bacterium]|nr:MAG: hypothetical protein EA423_10430 [Phycisphaerales bacterium]